MSIRHEVIAATTISGSPPAAPIFNPRGSIRGLWALGTDYTDQRYGDPVYGARDPLVDISGNGLNLTATGSGMGATYFTGGSNVFLTIPVHGDTLAGIVGEMTLFCVSKAPIATADSKPVLMGNFVFDGGAQSVMIAYDAGLMAYNNGGDFNTTASLPTDSAQATQWTFVAGVFTRSSVAVYRCRSGLNSGVSQMAVVPKFTGNIGGARNLNIGSALGFNVFGNATPQIALAGIADRALRQDELDRVYSDVRLALQPHGVGL